VVAVAALLLGWFLPLAPAAHALLGAGGGGARDHVQACGDTAEPSHPGDRAPPAHHEESDCPVCDQLALAKRVGLAPVSMPAAGPSMPVARLTPREPDPVVVERLGREGEPRAPPRAACAA